MRTSTAAILSGEATGPAGHEDTGRGGRAHCSATSVPWCERALHAHVKRAAGNPAALSTATRGSRALSEYQCLCAFGVTTFTCVASRVTWSEATEPRAARISPELNVGGVVDDVPLT